LRKARTVANRPKAIGTAGETAVVRYARANGFPLADRRPLKGNLDEGDILLCPGVVLEVKAGKAAQNASLGQVRAWLDETEIERLNGDADVALLVKARRGYGPARVAEWEVWGPFLDSTGLVFTMTTTLEDSLRLLRADGYGDPL
jgi:hypothetical protein